MYMCDSMDLLRKMKQIDLLKNHSVNAHFLSVREKTIRSI